MKRSLIHFPGLRRPNPWRGYHRRPVSDFSPVCCLLHSTDYAAAQPRDCTVVLADDSTFGSGVPRPAPNLQARQYIAISGKNCPSRRNPLITGIGRSNLAFSWDWLQAPSLDQRRREYVPAFDLTPRCPSHVFAIRMLSNREYETGHLQSSRHTP